LGLQLVEIGTAFGGRDHSTVIHSLEKVLELNIDPEYKRRIDSLRESLRQLPR
jgi:chromosomal replication initiator protein